MKKSILVLFLFTLAALPAFARQRQRLFDNFDTSRGVEVYHPTFVPVGAKSKPITNNKAASGKYAAGRKLVQKTVQSRQAMRLPMNVSEGLADREMANAPAASRLKMGFGSQLKGFTTGDLLVDSYIVDSCRRYGIDPLLIYSQMHQESSFKLNATSNKGASGLMQLMPGTARRMGVTNIYDAKQNIDGGVKYMRLLLDMFGGDVSLALAGYNAGEGAVMKYGNQIPPYNETQEYVRRISARYASISDGTFVHSIRRVNSSTAAKLEKNEARPLDVYEPSPVAIRLADGRMRLVNQ